MIIIEFRFISLLRKNSWGWVRKNYNAIANGHGHVINITWNVKKNILCNFKVIEKSAALLKF